MPTVVESKIKPKDNYLLAALPAEVFDRLLPDLKPVTMPLGKVIYESGSQLEHVYWLSFRSTSWRMVPRRNFRSRR
jgi:hypothetical protein